MENWKAVAGFEGLYEVSSHGNVRSIAIRNGGHPGMMEGALVRGYRRFVLHRNGSTSRKQAHRLVVEAFIGPIPVGMQVNHKNGVKHDNNIDNLEIVSPSQNRYHSFAVLNRRAANGSAHGRSKLTESQVLDIRRLDKEGMTRKELSARFSIGPQMLSFIINRKNWTHI